MILDNAIKNYEIENLKAQANEGKDFEFFRFEYFNQDIDHLKDPHRHNFYALILITDGDGQHVVDFVDYDLRPGRLFFINYGQVHAWKQTNHTQGYVVLFTNDFYNRIYFGHQEIKSEKALSIKVPFVDLNSEELSTWVQLMNHIESEYKKAQQFQEEVLCLQLKLAMMLYKRAAQHQPEFDMDSIRKINHIEQYKSLINEHYHDWKIPKKYAEVLHITPNYLNTLCKLHTGHTAGWFIKERVLLEAKRYLTHSTYTVTQIAERLGFNDKSHFGKYFKNFLGSTPEQFRKQQIATLQ